MPEGIALEPELSTGCICGHVSTPACSGTLIVSIVPGVRAAGTSGLLSGLRCLLSQAKAESEAFLSLNSLTEPHSRPLGGAVSGWIKNGCGSVRDVGGCGRGRGAPAFGADLDLGPQRGEPWAFGRLFTALTDSPSP